MRKRHIIILLVLTLLLHSCSAPAPLPNSRLALARQELARAYASGALELAPREYMWARGKLAEAERLRQEGETERADLFLTQSVFFSRKALSKAGKTWESIRAGLEETANPAPPDAAERVLPPAEEPKLAEPPSPAGGESEARGKKITQPAPKSQPLTVYVVKGGETLWTIAAQRAVYRDALLWPLLYKANRDQIKDPRQIYPEQILAIPRDVSEQEMEEAREKARRSEIFPLEVLLRQGSDGEK